MLFHEKKTILFWLTKTKTKTAYFNCSWVLVMLIWHNIPQL